MNFGLKIALVEQCSLFNGKKAILQFSLLIPWEIDECKTLICPCSFPMPQQYIIGAILIKLFLYFTEKFRLGAAGICIFTCCSGQLFGRYWLWSCGPTSCRSLWLCVSSSPLPPTPSSLRILILTSSQSDRPLMSPLPFWLWCASSLCTPGLRITEMPLPALWTPSNQPWNPSWQVLIKDQRSKVTGCDEVPLFADRKILYLGLIQSLFEGAMYTFVLEWTPALTPSTPPHESGGKRHLLTESDGDDDGHIGAIPHGYIFAAFMVRLGPVSALLPQYLAVPNVWSPP